MAGSSYALRRARLVLLLVAHTQTRSHVISTRAAGGTAGASTAAQEGALEGVLAALAWLDGLALAGPGSAGVRPSGMEKGADRERSCSRAWAMLACAAAVCCASAASQRRGAWRAGHLEKDSWRADASSW